MIHPDDDCGDCPFCHGQLVPGFLEIVHYTDPFAGEGECAEALALEDFFYGMVSAMGIETP